MTGATWFVGDLHFGHEKVAALRGFANTDAHDAALIRQWTKQVSDADTVFVLGDVSGGSRTSERHALNVLWELPGHKRLIAGNHDSVSGVHRSLSPHTARFNTVFERVQDFGRVRIERRQVMLSHFPYQGDHTDVDRYPEYRLPDVGHPLIHAHTHRTERFNGRQACVSWEAWGRLVSLGDLLPWLRELPDTLAP